MSCQSYPALVGGLCRRTAAASSACWISAAGRATARPCCANATRKFVTFIDAMLSLVVTQDVLPEAEGAQHAAQSSGLFGIGLGALTMVIGLWMLLRRRWAAVDSVLDSEQ